MRLQNIRLPDPDICTEEELYFHRNGKWIDFNGYFNLFYIEKRKKYTNQETLILHLNAKNCSAIRLMHDSQILQEIKLTSSTSATFNFPYKNTEKGVFWFSIKTNEKNILPEITGYYEGSCLEIKEVRIATIICAFKRELYVLQNLKRVIRFLEKPENASLNLCYWLIDNGKTLSTNKEICCLVKQYPDNFKIIENRNVGGVGGFTKGIIKALTEKTALGLTHVQLMDDDASFDPELFVRAYGFLSMTKNEYQNITLGGSLLREDFPYIQQAAGEWFDHFAVQNDFLLADLRKFEICTHKYMCESIHKNVPYSGWWCCCMSLNIMDANNLPLPLFLHHDDIEFGIRNQKYGIVFLNGFSVWHKGFELTFPGVNTYYDIRNSLITTALTQSKQPPWGTIKWLWKRLFALFVEYRYEEMHLVYLAFKDFCKGPDWLYKTDAEVLNNSLRKQTLLKPLEELKNEMPENDYTQANLYIHQYKDSYNVENLKSFFETDWKKTKLINKLTLNGWLLPSKSQTTPLSPTESPFNAFRSKQILLFEPLSLKYALKRREYTELVNIVFMCIKIGFSSHKLVKANQAYKKGAKELTNITMWKQYLNIEN